MLGKSVPRQFVNLTRNVVTDNLLPFFYLSLGFVGESVIGFRERKIWIKLTEVLKHPIEHLHLFSHLPDNKGQGFFFYADYLNGVA